MGNVATQKIIPKCHDPVTILTDGDDLCNKYFGNSWTFDNIEKSDCPDKYLRASCKKGDMNSLYNPDNYIHKQIIFDKDDSDFKQNILDSNLVKNVLDEDIYISPINNVSYNSLAPCNFSNCNNDSNIQNINYKKKKKENDSKIIIPKARYHMDRVLKPESTEKFTDTKSYITSPDHIIKIGDKKCDSSLFHNIIHVTIFFICIYLLYCLFSNGSGLI